MSQKEFSMLSSPGNITAYHPEYRKAPSDAQLEKLTVLALFSITPGPNGTVPMVRGGWADNISDAVNRAHEHGVRVVISLGGWRRAGSFPESVKPKVRETFVNNIVTLVNQNNFDGVDIDWEYPATDEEKINFEAFMVLLKQKLGDKILSFAIGAHFAVDFYSAATLGALDALYLMTYDGQKADCPHHADMAWTKGVVDNWADSGVIAKEKIYLGVPFYGRSATGEETYSAIISPNQASLSQTNFNGVYYYDGIPQIKEKTQYAWEKKIGGIVIWETGQDVEAASPYSLLKAVYDETQRLKKQ